MAQVRLQFLRLVVTYLWHCGIPACDQEPECRLLNYTSLQRLQESALRKFRTISDERFMDICRKATVWVTTLSMADFAKYQKKYDMLGRVVIPPGTVYDHVA